MAEDRAYHYDRPLTVEKLVASPTLDAFKAVDYSAVGNWETHWTGFCRRMPTGGREYLRAVRTDASISCVLKVRWCAATAAIKPQTMRVQFQGRELSISVVEDLQDEHREVLLGCTEQLEA